MRRRYIPWSQIQKRTEEHLCAFLVTRVQIHTTRYTKDEEIGRLWILLDRKPIFSAHDVPGAGSPTWFVKEDESPPACVYWNTFYGREECERGLHFYLDSTIEQCLESDNPFVRALAMFDKRLGKRRLSSMNLKEDEAPVVKHFYQLRCEAERIKPHGLPFGRATTSSA